jgi:hypothetical protein
VILTIPGAPDDSAPRLCACWLRRKPATSELNAIIAQANAGPTSQKLIAPIVASPESARV